MAEVSETTVSAIKALAWLGSTLGGGGASRRELSKQPLNAACLPSLCGAGACKRLTPRIVAERGERGVRPASPQFATWSKGPLPRRLRAADLDRSLPAHHQASARA